MKIYFEVRFFKKQKEGNKKNRLQDYLRAIP